MVLEGAFPLAVSGEAVIAGIAGILGAGAGAAATGLTAALTGRSDRRNKWLEFKRGNARKFMQHIAVHSQGGEVGEDDERLIGHYYVLALAVRDDNTARALYSSLPEQIKARVHDPEQAPFRHLREEVTPGRRALAPPGTGEA